MANFLIKNGVDENGLSVGIKVSESPWEKWPGTGSGNAPVGLEVNAIGFDGDGLMYDYTAHDQTWTATTQTFTGFIGK